MRGILLLRFHTHKSKIARSASFFFQKFLNKEEGQNVSSGYKRAKFEYANVNPLRNRHHLTLWLRSMVCGSFIFNSTTIYKNLSSYCSSLQCILVKVFVGDPFSNTSQMRHISANSWSKSFRGLVTHLKLL